MLPEWLGPLIGLYLIIRLWLALVTTVGGLLDCISSFIPWESRFKPWFQADYYEQVREAHLESELYYEEQATNLGGYWDDPTQVG